MELEWKKLYIYVEYLVSVYVSIPTSIYTLCVCVRVHLSDYVCLNFVINNLKH